MQIGNRIASLRKKAGLTQEQLADAIGTSRQAVSKWESGKAQPDLDYAIRMGTHFGVSMDYLLLGQESGEPAVQPVAEPEEKKTQRYNGRAFSILFALILIISTAIYFLLPLFASMYQMEMMETGSWLTYAEDYLEIQPLRNIVLLDRLGLFAGVSGLCWVYREQVKKIVEFFIDGGQ